MVVTSLQLVRRHQNTSVEHSRRFFYFKHCLQLQGDGICQSEESMGAGGSAWYSASRETTKDGKRKRGEERKREDRKPK